MSKTIPGQVRVNIPTALCFMMFTPSTYTGTDSDTRPGVGFTFEPYPELTEAAPFFQQVSGVMTRTDAKRLRDMLDRFLASNPPEAGS